MSGFAKKILNLFLICFICFCLATNSFSQEPYPPLPTLDPLAPPPPGSCNQGGCSRGCQCGAFFCDAQGYDTRICCTPDCPSSINAADNRSCWQEPPCDNITTNCRVSTDCVVDTDPFHQCGDLSGVDSCLILPHCDYGECWFECRCADTGEGGPPPDEPPPPSGDEMTFGCMVAPELRDDTGQEIDILTNTKNFKIVVAHGEGREHIKTMWFGIFPNVFPEINGPDLCGKSPTKYPNCGTIPEDSCKDEFSLIDNYLDPDAGPVPTDLITNMVVNDSDNRADWSIRKNLQIGNLQYGDRDYQFGSIPGNYLGSEWIRTANDSKGYTGTTLVSFQVTAAVDVYVAHNDRDPHPSWLDSWTDTGGNLVNTEDNPQTFSLFRRSFSSGQTVSLGDNGSTKASMYTIIVKPTGFACSWSDTGRPGFFGVQITPDHSKPYNSNRAFYNVFNRPPPGACPEGPAATSGDISNYTGTGTLLGLNDNVADADGRQTFIQPDPDDPNRLIVYLRIKTQNSPGGQFSYRGGWRTFLMVEDDEGDFRCDEGSQYEETACSLVCYTKAPACPDFKIGCSPADGSTVPFSPSVRLSWPETSDWGTDCVGGVENDVYRVYVKKEGDSSIIDDPSNLQCTVPRGQARICNFTGLEQGETYNWTAIPFNGGEGADAPCIDPTILTFTVSEASAWFQTVAGDVHSQNNISSSIGVGATEPYFSLSRPWTGGPGVVSYEGNPANNSFGAGQVSEPGWLVKHSFANPYTYAVFAQKFINVAKPIGDSISINDLASGVYYKDKELEIKESAFTGEKQVIILVDKEVTISGNISVQQTPGQKRFLAVLAQKDILVNGAVGEIHGFFFTEKNFNTCASGSCDKPLIARGIYIAKEFFLKRSLANNNNPAEQFFLRPDFLINSPDSFWQANFTWEELAP